MFGLNAVVNMSFHRVMLSDMLVVGLNQNIESAKVKLAHHQVTVNLEIDQDKLTLIKAHHEGLGGFPRGTQ